MDEKALLIFTTEEKPEFLPFETPFASGMAFSSIPDSVVSLASLSVFTVEIEAPSTISDTSGEEGTLEESRERNNNCFMNNFFL